MFNIKNIALFFILFLLVLIIIYSWFNTKQIISNGSEEDLNILRSQALTKYYADVWYPYGTGLKIPYYLAKTPQFFVLGQLEKVGIPIFLIQAIFLFLLMLLGILSAYLLLYKGLDINPVASLIGAIFYTLNIYSMTQVWKRFLYEGMFGWAYLPLFIFLWIKWIGTKKILWLILFLSSSLVFSHAFTRPANLFAFWVPAAIFSLIKIWQHRRQQTDLIKVILISLIGLTTWVAVNFWWFYPTATLSVSSASESTGGWKSDLSSADAVSKYFPIWEVLLLRQSWYLGPQNDWNDFYNNPLVIIISLGVLLVAFYGLIKSKNQKYRGFILSLGAVGLFVSKGTSFPLGYVFFYLLFSLFPVTTALRNPYEKFGIVWLLPYTVFFTIGFYKLVTKFKRSFRFVFAFLLLILFCGILVYPMWNGDIFPSKHRLNIPSYYNEAKIYLNSQSEGRIFDIPFLLELERRSYSWGYIGQDPTENLFDEEPASKPKLNFYDRLYKLFPGFIYHKNFPRILGLLGVSDVILHKDSVYPQLDYSLVKNDLDNWEGVGLQRNFDQLEVYSLDLKLVKHRIYPADKTLTFKDPEEALQKILSGELNDEKIFLLEEDMPAFDINQNYSRPSLSFKQITNTHYLVEIKSAEDPFILVLNETFDKLWEAKIDGISLESHFIVNGFANGWLIGKEGDYTVDIRLKVWPWD